MFERKKSGPHGILKMLAAIAVLAAVTASQALAAPQNPYGGGSRIPQSPETIDRGHHQTRLILKDFARCNVKAHHEDVRNYLLEDVGEAETAKLRRKALTYNCLDSAIGPDDLQMSLTGVSLQGSLAEQMLSVDGLLSRPLDVGFIAPLHHSDLNPDDLKKLDADARAQSIAQAYVFRFGECVVRADAAGSAALLKTEADSVAENAAFNKLMPAFRSCVETNRTLTGDKIEIRGTIAYNYYRLAFAPRVPAPRSSRSKKLGQADARRPLA